MLTSGAKGFRPFFLLAALFAVFAAPYWVLAFTGKVAPGGPLAGIVWHGHEMIYGFTAAVIAGFLLTAVSSWTGRETATGAPLWALVALWAAGRVGLLVIPGWVGSAVDLLFLPVLAGVIARPILSSGSRRNYGFPLLLIALALANLAVHLDAHGVWPGTAILANRVAVHVIAVILLVVAGRVVPMFTRNTTGMPTRSYRALDGIAIVGTAAVAALQGAPSLAAALPFVAGVAALAVFGRMWGWGVRHVWGEPLLWVLHVGHAFVGLGLALEAAQVPASMALHAITIGGIGVLILGMMARVGLGHTGRPLQAHPAVAVAFGSLVLAALIRVFGPALAPQQSVAWYWAAAILWSAAFAVHVVIYAPILLYPRPDGKPG